MADNTERQLREADAAVDKAVADFISKIELMSERWDAVAPAYILESVLLALCEEMTRPARTRRPKCCKLANNPRLREAAHPRLTRI